jgi:hypothetical protein
VNGASQGKGLLESANSAEMRLSLRTARPELADSVEKARFSNVENNGSEEKGARLNLMYAAASI